MFGGKSPAAERLFGLLGGVCVCVLDVNKKGYFQPLWRHSKIPGFLVATAFVFTSIMTNQVNISK